VKPNWKSKRDPEQQPIRFLAGVWEQRMMSNFGITVRLTSKEMGQLKLLKKSLGDLTRDVIEWMLNPVNWWHFCQQVRAESGLHHAPDHPHVGFLLAQHGRGLKIMRWRLSNSTAPADVSFCTRLDQLRYEQWKSLVLVCADGIPERLTKIAAATTLTDIQLVFIDIADESTG
jgi:hypothetical protein